jgi:hypothetical protein
MYIFTKLDRRYPVIGTKDGKHLIVVNCSEQEIDNLAKERKLTADSREKLWIVYPPAPIDEFNYAIFSLPRRLDPLNLDGTPKDHKTMYKFFYKTAKRQLLVKGIYVGITPSPFTEYIPKEGEKILCLADLRLP